MSERRPEPPVDLAGWRALWERDARWELPAPSGVRGTLVAGVRKLLRPLFAAPLADLWQRQRAFNLVVQEQLERQAGDQAAIAKLTDAVAGLGRDLQTVQQELGRDIRHSEQQLETAIREASAELLTYIDAHEQQIRRMAELESEGFDEMRRHHEAAFGLLDHKLEHYRRRASELRASLVSLLEIADDGGAPALAEAVEEQAYLELERRHRGTEAEIRERIAPYLEFFGAAAQGGGEVVDLGCGRGEALTLLAERGIPARGVDSNGEMVARCREQGLAAEQGDLFDALREAPAGTLGGVISFHVIEHLTPAALQQLVLLAWRALRPGGVLVVETPNPLSVVVGASSFWLDPTHQRPVHPDALELLFEHAGFEAVERIDRQPFAADRRLPEIELEGLSGEVLRLADEVNRLRDRLDAVLYGFQDYGMVGRKPEPA